MATNHKPTAKAEAPRKKRTVREVTLQEVWKATQERRENLARFANLVIEMKHIMREMRVCNNPDHFHDHTHLGEMDDNAKAREEVKAKIAKARKVIARYEKQQSKRSA